MGFGRQPMVCTTASSGRRQAENSGTLLMCRIPFCDVLLLLFPGEGCESIRKRLIPSGRRPGRDPCSLWSGSPRINIYNLTPRCGFILALDLTEGLEYMLLSVDSENTAVRD